MTTFIQCVRKVAVHLQKVLEVISTSFYTDLNAFNFIRKHFLQICVRKVSVNLQKLLEVMSTSAYTGLNPYRTVAQMHIDFPNARYYVFFEQDDRRSCMSVKKEVKSLRPQVPSVKLIKEFRLNLVYSAHIKGCKR
jgi:hypothetical protein